MKTIPSTPLHAVLKTACPLFLLGSAIGLLTGCVTEPESHVVSAPPPDTAQTAVVATPGTTTTTTGAVAPATTTTTTPTVVVTQAPPAIRQEVVSARPSTDHVWVPGYWTWRNARYEWVAGRWEIPPVRGAVWVPPRWTPEGSQYRFYEGYWDY